ncbi:hypothetical protein SAMN05421823_11929 [Catalinimonas alkaloidigena]|uniref:Uncharacterized protein n=1 Tax=Catalinimonas alkaloidigena TaxID=1075417 RepID=A0A1G9V6Z8_9BACT|nr:hypothetical protein [Catalinimonas alkaloidigena]SDM67675.1 hypothetical protein SAMN05421823_11929 [Catalinimonas alkaloidigena]
MKIFFDPHMTLADDQLILLTVATPKGGSPGSFDNHVALLRARLISLIQAAREDGESPVEVVNHYLGTSLPYMTDLELAEYLLEIGTYAQHINDTLGRYYAELGELSSSGWKEVAGQLGENGILEIFKHTEAWYKETNLRTILERL